MRKFVRIYIEAFLGKLRTQLRQIFILSRAFVSISYQLFQGEDFREKNSLLHKIVSNLQLSKLNLKYD